MIRRCVQRDRECGHIRALWKAWDGFPHDRALRATGADHVLALAELERLAEAARRNAALALMAPPPRKPGHVALVRRQFPRAAVFGPNPRLKRRLRAYDRAAVRATRATVKRSVKIVSAILGEAVARDLAAGREIDVPAGSLTFRLRAPRPSARGHGAVSVRLVDNAGLPLASVCVFQEAPAFDQVASVALHAAAGRAMKIIETGNLFHVEPAAVDHPAIGEKARVHAERVLDAAFQRPRVDRIDMDPLFREISPMVIGIVEAFVIERRCRA